MRIGSPIYILTLFGLVGLTAGVYFLFRKKSTKIQNIVLWFMMVVNVAQHLFKALIYPHHIKDGFTIVSTAYNVCAVLILFMPLAFALKSRFLKNFFFFVGAVAGLGAIAYPVWFLDQPSLGWEYLRFYVCHAFLFLTAILPLLWGRHRPAFRECWQIGVAFLAVLCLILLNNVIFTLLGYNFGADFHYGPATLYEGLLQHNACALMAPPAGMPWLGDVASFFTLPAFAGHNPTGLYAPILWYAIPVYLGCTAGAALLFGLLRKYGLTEEPNQVKAEKEATV